ncbi:MAG: class I SAM-dependent methyltransferase [Calditrichaeota bacterium]|jgi:SAM-dependent methyltransferase|nr:class I SAM-dependent methyltransferase [Calditrichota bacterium]
MGKIYEHISHVYDLFWGKWSPGYVSLISETLEGQMPDKVTILDLGCGTGVLAVELARLGYTVDGVDISPQMIEMAESKATEFPQVNFKVADMVELETTEKFDCVTCTFDSINYLLEIGQLQKFMINVSTKLKPGGFFIFDSNTALLYETCQKGEFQRELGGQSFTQKLNFDPLKRLSTTTFNFSNGKKEVHHQRPYDPDEITLCLKDAGMEVIRTYGGLKGEPFLYDSKRLICVAEKPF